MVRREDQKEELDQENCWLHQKDEDIVANTSHENIHDYRHLIRKEDDDTHGARKQCRSGNLLVRVLSNLQNDMYGKETLRKPICAKQKGGAGSLHGQSKKSEKGGDCVLPAPLGDITNTALQSNRGGHGRGGRLPSRRLLFSEERTVVRRNGGGRRKSPGPVVSARARHLYNPVSMGSVLRNLKKSQHRSGGGLHARPPTPSFSNSIHNSFYQANASADIGQGSNEPVQVEDHQNLETAQQFSVERLLQSFHGDENDQREEISAGDEPVDVTSYAVTLPIDVDVEMEEISDKEDHAIVPIQLDHSEDGEGEESLFSREDLAHLKECLSDNTKIHSRCNGAESLHPQRDDTAQPRDCPNKFPQGDEEHCDDGMEEDCCQCGKSILSDEDLAQRRQCLGDGSNTNACKEVYPDSKATHNLRTKCAESEYVDHEALPHCLEYPREEIRKQPQYQCHHFSPRLRETSLVTRSQKGARATNAKEVLTSDDPGLLRCQEVDQMEEITKNHDTIAPKIISADENTEEAQKNVLSRAATAEEKTPARAPPPPPPLRQLCKYQYTPPPLRVSTWCDEIPSSTPTLPIVTPLTCSSPSFAGSQRAREGSRKFLFDIDTVTTPVINRCKAEEKTSGELASNFVVSPTSAALRAHAKALRDLTFRLSFQSPNESKGIQLGDFHNSYYLDDNGDMEDDLSDSIVARRRVRSAVCAFGGSASGIVSTSLNHHDGTALSGRVDGFSLCHPPKIVRMLLTKENRNSRSLENNYGKDKSKKPRFRTGHIATATKKKAKTTPQRKVCCPKMRRGVEIVVVEPQDEKIAQSADESHSGTFKGSGLCGKNTVVAIDENKHKQGSSKYNKYRCRRCGQPKQKHVCKVETSLQRSIGIMVYPAVNAFTSHEGGIVAPPLSEMNNFMSLEAPSSSSLSPLPSPSVLGCHDDSLNGTSTSRSSFTFEFPSSITKKNTSVEAMKTTIRTKTPDHSARVHKTKAIIVL